jgi:methylenetetrahydrofolate--tRNA-(uracil-5-)-methyltransferase
LHLKIPTSSAARSSKLNVIGGGLAGSEAAWQLASAGFPVRLFEMRPIWPTPAHQTGLLAELVCSNSLKSNALNSASGLLKEEMRRLGSLILRVAEDHALPAGSCLAVDRHGFSSAITSILEKHAHVEIVREEVTSIPPEGLTIIATGPLTSSSLHGALNSLIEESTATDSFSSPLSKKRGLLSFFDATSPIVLAESLDLSKVFRASRYGRGGDDYLNCPLDQGAYERLWEELARAEAIEPKDFEIPFFEGCLPIEELAVRGKDALRFGPLKPVGLTDPSIGKRPWAVVQLRLENREATMYSLVGFQTRMRWGEQRKVFRTIPGLEQAEFCRYGSMHRNTFLNSPILVDKNLQWKTRSGLFFAGQITGVEGYVESAAMGLLAGINVVSFLRGKPLEAPPKDTALGSLVRYITEAHPEHFQPMNINFGLFPPLEEGRRIPFRERRERYASRSLAALDQWKANHVP